MSRASKRFSASKLQEILVPVLLLLLGVVLVAVIVVAVLALLGVNFGWSGV